MFDNPIYVSCITKSTTKNHIRNVSTYTPHDKNFHLNLKICYFLFMTSFTKFNLI